MHPVDMSSKHRQESQRSGGGIWFAIIGLVVVAAIAIVALVAMSEGEADSPPADQSPVDAPVDPGL